MARTHLSIRVDLVGGGGQELWPRPGRVFVAARSHTFDDLAKSIDAAFARWDLAHLHLFTLGDETSITRLDHWGGEHPEDAIDGSRTKLSRLTPGEQFVYVFDLGDNWEHLCTVADERIDPYETLGIAPDRPEAHWGWGTIPDQYGRRWDGDDGESDPPADPGLTDLPPLLPWWGPRREGPE